MRTVINLLSQINDLPAVIERDSLTRKYITNFFFKFQISIIRISSDVQTSVYKVFTSILFEDV